MKKHCLVGLILLFTHVAESMAAPVIVSVDPTATVVAPGSSFIVDLLADLPDPVIGWGLDLSFSSAVISLANVELGPLWSPATSVDDDALVGLAFPSAVTGTNVLLATLMFTATGSGQTALIPSYTLGDFTEGFALESGDFAEVQFENGTVSVVPEPSTGALLFVGVAAVCLYCGVAGKHTFRSRRSLPASQAQRL